jgi:PAS domain S-box-containing protein
MFKLRPEEAEGVLFYALGDGQWDIPKMRELLEGILPDRKAVDNFEVEHSFKALGTRTMIVNARRICLDDGGTCLTLLAIEDTTDRKKAEEALQLSREYFRALVENARDVIVILNEDGTIRYESASYKSILGYDPEEEVGKSGFEYVHPDDMEKATETFHKLIGSPLGSSVQAELRARHKDGTWHTIEVIGRNLLGNPAVRGIVANFRDITELRKAEADLSKYHRHLQELVEERTLELKNANELLEQEVFERRRVESELKIKEFAIASSLNAVAIGDLEGNVQYVNKSFLALWGYDDSGEVIGRPAGQFWRDQRGASNAVGLLLENGSWQGEAIALRRDGSTFVAHLSASVVRDNAGDPVCLIASFVDITDRKRTEFKLQELYARERETRRQIEAEINRRAEFTRVLAHELKTPLTSVLTASEALVSELRSEALLRLARSINRSACNLDKRINELLDLARGEVGMLQLKLEPVDIAQLIKGVVDDFAPIATNHRQFLSANIPSHLPMVSADPDRIVQVVTNLLSNAIKFTPEGGAISVRVREKGDAILVEVQDTGRGIAFDEQRHLFEPYGTRGSNAECSDSRGLGLALCKMLIGLHGGQIWVTSEVGRGSTFSFSIPAQTSEHGMPQADEESKAWKLLIIEDDAEIVESLCVTFQMRWPELRLVSTPLGEKGIEMVRNEAPDLVILDLALPDISGFEVLRRIRLYSTVPIIILTVKATEDDIVKGLDWGADDYVVKPFKQSEFLARVKAQLRKSVADDKESRFVRGALRFDPSTLQLKHDGREIKLTTIEGRILQCLMMNAGHVVTYRRLCEYVWGADYPGCIESLRVHIRRLRSKVEKNACAPTIILTKSNVGYMFAAPASLQDDKP